MKRTFTFLTAVFGLATLSFGQVGSVAPDFTVTDIDGNTHTLSTYLSQGKVVVLDCSTTWCGTCWSFHNDHFLEDLNNQYGPNGTDQIVVLYYEADASTTLADLQGTGGNTLGDWLTGSSYPFINETTLSLSGANYWPLGFPTINVIDPATGIIQADLYDSWGGGLSAMVDVIDDYWTTASVEEVAALTNLTVYPNPASATTNIKVDLNEASEVTATVYNLLGEVVATEVFVGAQGSNTFAVNTNDLSNGQYILKVTLGDGVAENQVQLNIMK